MKGKEKFEELNTILNGLAEDFEKFYTKNNKTAGIRIRKGMQQVKDVAQIIRKDIQELKNKAD